MHSAPVKTPKLVKTLKSVGKQIANKSVKPENPPRENTAINVAEIISVQIISIL